jgi:hypothetical protein
MEALKEADLLVIFARFLNPAADQMAHLEDYLVRGGPVVGLRTSSHGFKIPANAPTAKYSFDSKVAGFEKGFGHQVLGNTWVGHHGDNHRQGTRIELVPAQKENPILKGVPDTAFCHAGGYVGKAAPDFTVLATSQPLVSMDPKAEADPRVFVGRRQERACFPQHPGCLGRHPRPRLPPSDRQRHLLGRGPGGQDHAGSRDRLHRPLPAQHLQVQRRGERREACRPRGLRVADHAEGEVIGLVAGLSAVADTAALQASATVSEPALEREPAER